MKSLVLIGFMGAGKSTIAQQLAHHYGYISVDLDAEIEATAGCSIPEIFDREGETGFRRREQAALADLSRRENLVVATGGGVVTVDANWPLLRQIGTVVYLHVSLETVMDRIKGGQGRPLARDPIAMKKLYAQRLSMYNQADHMVEADSLSPDEIAQQLVTLVGE